MFSSFAQTPYLYLFKFIIVGESATGKSCCLLRFTENQFNATHDMTIGVEFGARIIDIHDKDKQRTPVKIQVWDTAGMEGFRSITRTYYKNTAGVLLVYDITRRESFNRIRSWMEEVKKTTTGNPVMALVGNKKDKQNQRQVTYIEALNFATEHDLLFFETSALTGECVEDVFVEVSRRIYRNILSRTIRPGDNMCGVKLGGEMDVAVATPTFCNDKRDNGWACCSMM